MAFPEFMNPDLKLGFAFLLFHPHLENSPGTTADPHLSLEFSDILCKWQAGQPFQGPSCSPSM